MVWYFIYIVDYLFNHLFLHTESLKSLMVEPVPLWNKSAT